MNTYLRSDLKEAVKNILAVLYILAVVILIAIFSKSANAKVIYYGSGSEQVPIKYPGPTIFRFTKAVQTITGASHLTVKPANKSDPSYTTLAVTPLFTNGANEVSFFLTDGSVVRTKIVVSPNDPAADSFYDFKTRDSGESEGSENAPVISEVELLKAMVRDDSVSGYKVSKVSNEYPSKLSSVEVELIRIYKGSPFNGYVYRLTNTSWKKNIEVDVRHITVGDPNLAILAQSDEALLYPKGKGAYQTLLRIVAKNTASSGDVILAMEPQIENAQPGSNSKKGE